MTLDKQNYNKESNELSLRYILLGLRRLFRYLLSKWAILLIVSIIGGGLGLVYSYFYKPVYTAATTFVLENGDSGGGGLGQYAGLASMVGIDLGSGGGGGIFQGDNIIELYKSRKMIQSTLLTDVIFNGSKQLLVDRYIDINKLRESWNKNFGLKGITFSKERILTRLQDSLIGTIVNDINKNYLVVTKPDKKLSIIRAEVRSKDEFFAGLFNREIVKNVNDFYVQTKTKKSTQNVRILQHKTDSVRAVMNGAIYAAATVADETPNLNPTRQIQRVAPMQKSQFNAETNKAVLGELVKNLELSKMALLKETPLIQVIDEPTLPLPKNTFGKGKGVIIGGLFGFILVVFFFIVKRVLEHILD